LIGYLVLVPVGYLLGSVPFGLVVGWAFRRVDIRNYGSGSTGMTNVLRTLGVPAGILALLLDMGKAVLAVVLARVFTDSQGVEVAAALSTMFGHNWPVFFRFKGGKGTATGWASLLILSPIAGLVASVVGLGTAGITRYVSLGSLLGSTLGPAVLIVLVLLGREPLVYAWFGVIAAPLIIVQHKDNIERLIKGQERKLGRRVARADRPEKRNRGKGLRWPGSAL
jgi:glycerol-3-phosphate acyltransferase PlsY